MKCIIPGSSVKIFGRAIHCLSKIGEELYIEPMEHGLALRTVNSSRSAYACFVFAPSFFIHYVDELDLVETDESEEQETLKCKIGIKSVLAVFKSLSSLEKTVDKCKIKHDIEHSRLIFQLYCKHGIVKTFNLAYIECETLQAIFSKEMCPNVLCAQSKLLVDVVTNFQTSQEEVTLIVDPEKSTFKNYTEDEPDQSKVIHTELSLVPEEFESYQIGVDNRVTFCLKEMRAILGFSEPTNMPLSIHFESPGKPIVFSMDADSSFEANFALATLADRDMSSQVPSSQQSERQKAPPPRRKAQPAPKPSTSRDVPRLNGGRMGQGQAATTQRISSQTRNYPEQQEGSTKRSEVIGDTADGTRSRAQTETAAISDAMQNDDDGEEEDEPAGSPVIPFVSRQNSAAVNTGLRGRLSLLASDSSEDEDAVPGTPPAKRFKSVFMGLSQSTTASTQLSQTRNMATKILAPDTDDEDN